VLLVIKGHGESEFGSDHKSLLENGGSHTDSGISRIIGSVVTCAAQNIPMLIVGRIINGFSVGICSAQVPVYISELAPPSKRGRLVGLQQWAITWGILIMF
jgi:MFS family permease